MHASTKRGVVAGLGIAFGMTVALSAQAVELTGAGSTFAYPIYAKWASTYKQKTGVGLNYQSIGSGGGIKQIEAKTVDFGASDMPLKINVLKQNHLVQFPTVTGGVVMAVNLPGVRPGTLKLTRNVLADIYLGKIKKWNDPQIVALNRGLNLPDRAISVVHRSDGSGTTFIFTNYLSKISPEWRAKVGENASVNWPAGVGGKGSEGVAAYVQRIPGGIGYVEYAYALQNRMNYALVQNHDGLYVQPNAQTFQAAAAGAHWTKANGFYEILTNEPGRNSYPITGATFILMQQVQDKPQNGQQVLKFFNWAYANGSKEALSLDYIPMPRKAVQAIEASWKDIKTASGQSIWR